MESVLNKKFIQDYALAISSILEADVTIIDKDLIRIAGTGDYKNKLGEKIPEDSFFGKIILNGDTENIMSILKEDSCLHCQKIHECKELANIGEPIFLDGKIIGVIGVLAFNKKQKECLLLKREPLKNFLKYMSLLLESKLKMSLNNEMLKIQIEEAVNYQKIQTNENRFIGENDKIIEILELCDKVASSSSSIMITGESGTGKDVLAKYIHSISDRKDKLMISINCAAIPENLVESELFGYEEGAFTGAKKSGHIGKFELANKSTLFLDEIGDMSLPAQKKLLRVLQERKIERIGGKESIPVDVRIICATNKDLEKMIEENSFREDLYYRLNVIPIRIPALRERREDIVKFANYFIKYYNKKLNKRIEGITFEAEEVLKNYEWPGNIRELRNMLEYLENVIDEKFIDVIHLPDKMKKKEVNSIKNKNLSDILKGYEKNLLKEMLKGVTTVEEKDSLAEKLGISRATLYRKLQSYDL